MLARKGGRQTSLPAALSHGCRHHGAENPGNRTLGHWISTKPQMVLIITMIALTTCTKKGIKDCEWDRPRPRSPCPLAQIESTCPFLPTTGQKFNKSGCENNVKQRSTKPRLTTAAQEEQQEKAPLAVSDNYGHRGATRGGSSVKSDEDER